MYQKPQATISYYYLELTEKDKCNYLGQMKPVNKLTSIM